MLDFVTITEEFVPKLNAYKVSPSFELPKKTKGVSDIMIRNNSFYAIWVEDENRWSTDENDAVECIDKLLWEYARKRQEKNPDIDLRVQTLRKCDTKMIDKFKHFCEKQMFNNYHVLDEDITFLNDTPKKEDYRSIHVNYELKKGSTEAWDEMMSVLYDEEEKQKIEWGIGSIVSGDSKSIQKFFVLYGAAGTGKSTVLNIIQKMFDGYCCVFDAKALGSSKESFALEAFRNNPVVAIQHDGDLSKIEDNTRLNSLVSHEKMTVNSKNTKLYEDTFKCLLFIGTNSPVKITDGKSGILRRLIDVMPTGKKLNIQRYNTLNNQIKFEYGAIAQKCLEIYKNNKHLYDNYTPVKMLDASNDFYNFVLDTYAHFEKKDGVTLKMAWELYNKYCEDSNISYKLNKNTTFKEELKNYFWGYHERFTDIDGNRVRNYYSGFRIDKFENKMVSVKGNVDGKELIKMRRGKSLLDDVYADCPAQYATEDGKPRMAWSKVTTTLKDLDTTQLHYVKMPNKHHIVIDFDIPGPDGEKSLELNLNAASEFPKTYAELSKSGAGVHLHYIYDGDVDKLSAVYDDHIEIKVFRGNSSLRRKLSKCNTEEITTISSGLPFRKETNVLNNNVIESERHLKNKILKYIKNSTPDKLGKKEMSTTQSIKLINSVFEDAYNSDLKYDLSGLRHDIMTHAMHSTNNALECTNIVLKMKLKSKEELEEDAIDCVDDDGNDVFCVFDTEVGKNVFLLCYSYMTLDELLGKKPISKDIKAMINPTSEEVDEFIKKNKIVGFNNINYDNPIMYARTMGYTLEGLYELSKSIISNTVNKNIFPSSMNISEADVYDLSGTTESLKKWEIKKGIEHKEMDINWNEEIPENRWDELIEYCKHDVYATKIVFKEVYPEYMARKILAMIANAKNGTSFTPNVKANTLTRYIIFGNNKHPQNQFNYYNLSKGDMVAHIGLKKNGDSFWLLDEYTAFDDRTGLPFFPGYEFKDGVSTYRGEVVGEGGYVYSEEGMYGHTVCFDVEQMHPSNSSRIDFFGPYQEAYDEIRTVRNAIKHNNYQKAEEFMNGLLKPLLKDKSNSKTLSYALKIAINSVYGQTCAKYDNPFKDPRNIDNIIAKLGALFMINLKHEVQKRGYKVVHIKTDSIKIENPDEKIAEFINLYGELYGYKFEIEHDFEKLCLVNKSVFIGKESTGEWIATGKQFQVPYVYKTLFSHEPIERFDLSEIKTVTTKMFLDFNENLKDVTEYEKELSKCRKDFNAGKITESEYYNMEENLAAEIEGGHNYIFIGKVGQFTPVLPGNGGGYLMRLGNDGSYSYVGGTKGYRWRESITISDEEFKSIVDMDYYRKFVDDAIKTISKYGTPEEVDEFLEK